MSCRPTRTIFGALITLALVSQPVTALGAPSSAAVSADRERVERAAEQLEDARTEADRAEARLDAASLKLDGIVARQEAARSRLRSRASLMYRSGPTGFVEVLLGASSFEGFAARWDLLTRINREEARDLQQLRRDRRAAEKTARALMGLQAEEARARAQAAAALERARADLASSRSALKELEARATAPRPTASKDRAVEPAPTRTKGAGAWKKAVASHYSRTFTGRGASGQQIGPYSMIVAHKTLPFGTLIEFEYEGRRAVASVADRGPYTPGRTFDLGPGVVRALDFSGVHEVRYRIIGR